MRTFSDLALYVGTEYHISLGRNAHLAGDDSDSVERWFSTAKVIRIRHAFIANALTKKVAALPQGIRTLVFAVKRDSWQYSDPRVFMKHFKTLETLIYEAADDMQQEDFEEFVRNRRHVANGFFRFLEMRRLVFKKGDAL